MKNIWIGAILALLAGVLFFGKRPKKVLPKPTDDLLYDDETFAFI